MREFPRPQGAELWMNPKDLDAKMRERFREQGFEDLREILPESVQESLEQSRVSVEHALEQQFGECEVPKVLVAEMQHVAKAIEAGSEKAQFVDEVDDVLYEKLELLAAKILLYKSDPAQLNVKAIPGEGIVASYTLKDHTMHEYKFSPEDQDLVFNLEQWADNLTQMHNVQRFSGTLERLKERAESKPEPERAGFIRDEMVRKYSQYGFTDAQIESLLVISDDGMLDELVPEGELGGMYKLKVLKGVWDQYLTDEDKSQYVKFAAAMTALGAVEGLGPAMLGSALDSKENATAAAFTLGYLGVQLSAGWMHRKLTVGFDTFMHGIMERQEGLNERLARDLVFQPGERMSRTEDRGRILSAMRRSNSAFEDILHSMARVNAPALATTTVGLGAMMAMDWRLGLISLASAPVAVAIARKANNEIQPVVQESYRNESDLALEVEQQINAHQDIVLGDMRESMAKRIEELAKERNALQHQRTKARADMSFRAGYGLDGVVISGLTMAGVAIRNLGIEHGGDIVAALMYSGQFRRGFDQMVYTNNHLIESVAAIIEMEEVFNGYAQEEREFDRERVGVSELEDFAFELSGVGLSFGTEKILDDVSFKIPAGGVVRLEGKSGHGKTTLTRIMSGYYTPSEGEVKLGGVDLGDIKRTGPESLYSRMAYLSQHPYIFDSGNLKENLEFGNDGVSDEEMRKVIEELGLTHRFSKIGMVDLASSVRGLSGGEKARLGLARVLLKIRSQENGGVVFLDQATEELDEETEAEVAKILVQEKRSRPDTTFVIISHRSDFIRALEVPDDGGEGLEVQRVRLEHGALKG